MGASQGRADTMVPSSWACDCQDERKPPRLSRTIVHFTQRKEERKLTKPSGLRLYSRAERDQESPVRRGVGRIEVTQTPCDPVYDSDTPRLKNLGRSKSGPGRADQVLEQVSKERGLELIYIITPPRSFFFWGLSSLSLSLPATLSLQLLVMCITP
mmetsp:Transcript_38459/g.56547  ORF Transcript_38459/g.56547 Transcript_38459/m.56547 type:complete len:156 (-) Transcript_38459:431-898(-)